MLDIIRAAWKVTELRKKIFFTIMMILVFRIGSVLPVPFVDIASLQAADSNAFFSYLSVLTGGGLEYGAVLQCQ